MRYGKRAKHEAMVAGLIRRGIDPVKQSVCGSDRNRVSDRVRTGAIAAPRKAIVTDRTVTAGRKESPATEFAQARHEFNGDYVRRTPAKRSPVTNGAANHVRIAQLPKGTKPVWR